ncbi:ATP-binding response regulator [Azospirillum thermophilum]|uniref:histidine kinase n=1 Tax=Azospirillum thermophilum TaxID=2202148 RepID=A0A2S2CN57_9PROT|nr:response regulator [Azospirillum thermophilum]AWK85963.1 hypothetical protein DEW08_06550 [Azospirillum thermophilum]
MDLAFPADDTGSNLDEGAPRHPPRTILVVDDEPDLVAVVATELRCAGYRVLTAANGRDALERLGREPVDLVLADVSMPVMGGHELLRIVRSEHLGLADLPFLFLSALADRNDVIAGRQLGADDYLTKPVDFDLMLAAIAARLAAANRGAERRRAEVEEFRLEILSLLPHELLTPLTRILGWASLGKRSAERCACDIPECLSIAQALQEIDLGARALHHLVEGSIELVRIHGQPTRERQPTEIGDLVLGAVNVAKAHAAEAGVHLSAEIPDGLPEIDTDAHLLGSALCALLSEASKGMLRGDTVAVRIAWADARLDIVIERRSTAYPGRCGMTSLGIGSALAAAAAKALGGTFATTPVEGGDVSTLTLPGPSGAPLRSA